MYRLVTAEYGCALSIVSHNELYSVFFIPLVSIRINLKLWLCFVVRSKARCMLVVSAFELTFSYSYVRFLLFRGFMFDSCLVYHSLLEALAFERAGFFNPAVAVFPCFYFIFVDLRTALLLLETICFIFCMLQNFQWSRSEKQQ